MVDTKEDDAYFIMLYRNWKLNSFKPLYVNFTFQYSVLIPLKSVYIIRIPNLMYRFKTHIFKVTECEKKILLLSELFVWNITLRFFSDMRGMWNTWHTYWGFLKLVSLAVSHLRWWKMKYISSSVSPKLPSSQSLCSFGDLVVQTHSLSLTFSMLNKRRHDLWNMTSVLAQRFRGQKHLAPHWALQFFTQWLCCCGGSIVCFHASELLWCKLCGWSNASWTFWLTECGSVVIYT